MGLPTECDTKRREQPLQPADYSPFVKRNMITSSWHVLIISEHIAVKHRVPQLSALINVAPDKLFSSRTCRDGNARFHLQQCRWLSEIWMMNVGRKSGQVCELSTNLGGKYQGPWRLPCWSWPRRRGRPGHCREAQQERLPSSTRDTWKIKTTLLKKKARKHKRFELDVCWNLHGIRVHHLICTDPSELKFFSQAKEKKIL